MDESEKKGVLSPEQAIPIDPVELFRQELLMLLSCSFEAIKKMRPESIEKLISDEKNFVSVIAGRKHKHQIVLTKSKNEEPHNG